MALNQFSVELADGVKLIVAGWVGGHNVDLMEDNEQLPNATGAVYHISQMINNKKIKSTKESKAKNVCGENATGSVYRISQMINNKKIKSTKESIKLLLAAYDELGIVDSTFKNISGSRKDFFDGIEYICVRIAFKKDEENAREVINNFLAEGKTKFADLRDSLKKHPNPFESWIRRRLSMYMSEAEIFKCAREMGNKEDFVEWMMKNVRADKRSSYTVENLQPRFDNYVKNRKKVKKNVLF
ncbi:unnamed protein product [Caenorhabditis angaria]|uniref:Uncharacterized protein n=1 Tax=Caenorhabditis angaria TaxID=860376 RepID=A0A9P1I2S3_9PELO|nr:unnamed protein product [Caenorhabditis angaria]